MTDLESGIENRECEITQMIPADDWYAVYQEDDERGYTVKLICWGLVDGRVVGIVQSRKRDANGALSIVPAPLISPTGATFVGYCGSGPRVNDVTKHIPNEVNRGAE